MSESKAELFVTLEALRDHARKPENLARRFDLSDCKACLCCDLTGREMSSTLHIDSDPNDPDSRSGTVDKRFADFCDYAHRGILFEYRWPTGAGLGDAIDRMINGTSPQDAVEEMVACTNYGKTRKPQSSESSPSLPEMVAATVS